MTAALGTALAITAVAVCWLLAAQQRTQRDHNTALTAAKVPIRLYGLCSSELYQSSVT